MPNTAEKNIDITRDDIDNLEETLVIADENGLFKIYNKPTAFAEIVDNLAAACQEFDNKTNTAEERYVKGWQKYRAAYYQFDEVLNSASREWRLKYLYGAPFVAYFVAVLGVLFSAWAFFNPLLLETNVFWIPTYAFLWGTVGGVLQGLWFIWQHVSDRKLRKVWIPWYICLPLIGALLGALTYLVFIAGFITTTGATQIHSEYFIMLLCALAGFSSKWAVETLDKITNLVKIGE